MRVLELTCILIWWITLTLVRAVTTELVFRVPQVRVRHEASTSDKAVGTGAKYKLDNPQKLKDLEVTSPPFEEFFIEHYVSTKGAKKAARELTLDESGEIPGCHKCTARDDAYCQFKVINDHCCCDKKYREPFPWVPHDCYMGREKCFLNARHCAEYERIMECCCRNKLAEHYKAIFGSSSRYHSNKLPLAGAIVLVIIQNLPTVIF